LLPHFGAASALNAQSPSAALQTVYVASLRRPLTRFMMRKRLQGVPLAAVNCPRACASPEAPVFGLDHDCCAFGSGASRTLLALSRMSAMSSELKCATGVSARKLRLPAEAVISSVQPAMSAAAASHFARMPT